METSIDPATDTATQDQLAAARGRTPYLVVDERVVRRNVAEMAHRGRELGAAIRPHVKTHKSAELAAIQVEAGARGLTVATIGEAEVFADHGYGDLFIAYPLWLEGERLTRLRTLAERARVTIGVDSPEAARRASEAGPVRALVEVDSGHHRSGVDPARAGEVARAAVGSGVEVAGVFTFPGHSYDPLARASAAREETAALVVAAEALRTADCEPLVISGGSSPTMPYAERGAITELRPGVYVFGDAQQWELGVIGPEQVALTAYATVISRSRSRIVLDAGSKILGADRPGWASGFGRLLDHPDARVVLLSEHHAVAELSGEAPDLGAVVRVVPNHACNAVNLVDHLVVVGGSGPRWPVAARGRND